MAGVGVRTRSELLTLMRNLYRGLRIANTTEEPARNLPVWKVISKYGRLRPTSRTEQIAIQQLGETYLNYLNSTQHHLALISSYKGLGERSTKVTAHLMGFNLPDEPKVHRKAKNASAAAAAARDGG